MRRRHDGERLRKKLVRRATLYTYGFLAAALATAAGGAALVALLLTRGGLPFLETWVVLMIVILVPSLIGLVWRAVKERGAGRDDG